MEEGMLQCPVCQSTYDTSKHEAKLLSCHHSVCLTCLLKIAGKKSALKCPSCNSRTAVPPGGAQALQQNFYITQILQKQSDMVSPREMCSKHNHTLMFYCNTCSVAICMNCTVLDHDKSNGHAIQDIAAVVAELQIKLKENILQAKRSIVQRNNAIEALKTELECLESAKWKACEKVESVFQHLRGELEKREKLLLQEIEEQYTTKKNAVIKTGQMCRNESKQLSSVVANYERLTNGQGTRSELVKAANDTNMKFLSQQPGTSNQGGFVIFLYHHNIQPLTAAIEQFGAIDTSKDLPSVFKHHVPSVVAAQPATISIKAVSTNGIPLNQYPISTKITDQHEEEIPSNITFKSEGVYEVTFLPQYPGSHDLYFQFQGHTLSWSRSFEVKPNDPVLVIGQHGQSEGQLQRPTSVAIDTRQNVYIADMGNRRVQVFNKDGQYLNQFGLGSSKTTTYDIAINHATEELLCTKVAQPEQGPMIANTVRVFSLSGEKKRQFQCQEMKNGLFLTVNKKGWTIVCDSANNFVHIFSKEGAEITKFGGEGSKPGKLNFPAAVCVGQNDDIIVVDTKNHRVQIFDLQGKYKGQIGSQGRSRGQFYLPRGVAADENGHILVADSLNRIQIFKQGQFMACIDSSGSPINDPYNLAVTSDNHVFLSDFKNHCVKKYKYL